MPIYEYKCRECGGAFEELVAAASAAEHTPCPHCASHDVERLISSFGFTSGGTHSTDTRSSSSGHSCGSCSSHACSHCH
ncbi:MAG TPA: zinc ribbon domain-containing protein [bacterium]|nr:zinc ribbon domain-containing protein [bacterium]HQG46535.1 zinc ribbon domain-containing protein [bacterium]HQI48764.1 zinc ribbon domain-containing protein [bacterium]HQJ66125.1 zinc ribbon domain-containing protein [bacterium]